MAIQVLKEQEMRAAMDVVARELGIRRWSMPRRSKWPKIIFWALVGSPNSTMGYCLGAEHECHIRGNLSLLDLVETVGHELVHACEMLLTGTCAGYGKYQYENQHCEMLARQLENHPVITEVAAAVVWRYKKLA